MKEDKLAAARQVPYFYECSVFTCFRLAHLGVVVALRIGDSVNLPSEILEQLNSSIKKQLHCNSGSFAIAKWEVSRVHTFPQGFQSVNVIVEAKKEELPCQPGEAAILELVDAVSLLGK